MKHEYPTEIVQNGRTEFWTQMRDKKLEEHRETSEGKKIWRPIDYLRRSSRLRHLEQFIVRATTIIDESSEADRLIEMKAAAERQAPVQLTSGMPQEVPIEPLTLKQPEIA